MHKNVPSLKCQIFFPRKKQTNTLQLIRRHFGWFLDASRKTDHVTVWGDADVMMSQSQIEEETFPSYQSQARETCSLLGSLGKRPATRSVGLERLKTKGQTTKSETLSSKVRKCVYVMRRIFFSIFVPD